MLIEPKDPSKRFVGDIPLIEDDPGAHEPLLPVAEQTDELWRDEGTFDISPLEVCRKYGGTMRDVAFAECLVKNAWNVKRVAREMNVSLGHAMQLSRKQSVRRYLEASLQVFRKSVRWNLPRIVVQAMENAVGDARDILAIKYLPEEEQRAALDALTPEQSAMIQGIKFHPDKPVKGDEGEIIGTIPGGIAEIKLVDRHRQMEMVLKLLDADSAEALRSGGAGAVNINVILANPKIGPVESIDVPYARKVVDAEPAE